MAMPANWVRNWVIWVAFSAVGAIGGLFGGICAWVLLAALLEGFPLEDRFASLIDFGAEWAGGLVAGLGVGLLQSLALNFMQRGTLTRGLFERITLFWIGGTALAGGLIWWVALGSAQDWLFN